MKNPNDINKIFTEWGTSQRQLPPHNEELKRKMLAGFSLTESQVPVSANRTPWVSIAFAALAGLVFILNSGVIQKSVPGADEPMTTQTSAGVASAPVAPSARSYDMQMGNDGSVANQSLYKGMAPEYYPYYPQPAGVPATDSREFLRTDYNATIRTRDVAELTRRVETTVRGFDGRVDGSNSSQKWGSVSFVVPASKFEAFRNEIESFAPSRFIETEVRTENLLPQKQSIEEIKKQNDKDLAKYKADRQKLVSAHANIVASLQSQLAAVAYELSYTQVPARQQELWVQQASLQSRLTSENASYSKQLGYIDSTIHEIENNGQQIDKQDQNILDTVATVRGTISLSWISIWEIVELYVSFGWIIAILVGAAMISFFFERRRSQRSLF